MLFDPRKLLFARSVVILALLGGMFGAVPIELVYAEPMIYRISSNTPTLISSASTAPSTSLTLTVNSLLDVVDANPGNGVCETATDNGICSLRAAIQETNARSTADVINLPAGTYTLTLPGTFEDAAASGDLNITDDLTIMGTSSNETIIDGNGGVLQDRVIEIIGAINVKISDLTIRGGNADPNNGAGIANRGGALTLNRVVLRDNVGGHGAGLLNVGIAEIRQSMISNNIASDDAGGIRNDTTLTIIESTISNNVSRNTGGGIGNHGSLTIINSTISGNQTNNIGGGIAVGYGSVGQPNAIVDLRDVTITNNLADADNDGYGDGGGIYIVPTATVSLQNTILAGNTGPSGSPDCYGTLTSNGYNLIENTSGCTATGITTGNLIGAGPNLGPLQDNGGMTLTHALQPNSPAIDVGNNTTCKPTDQRGMTRPQGNGCDIGAYEFQPTPMIYYVKWNATGANDGTSWADAYIDLQSALSAASSGDEIWVAAGTYKPTSTTDRSISFNLKNGVSLFGGFTGTETSRAQRNYETNLTMLSGDLGVQGNNSDNSYHVVKSSNTNTSAMLDGFTVRGGNADHSAPSTTGGGLDNFSGSPSVANVIFTSNYAVFGGGMHSQGAEEWQTSNPVLKNVKFLNNSAVEGGGMRNWGYSSPTLTDVVFESNSVIRAGGGMLNGDYSHPILTNVTFINNTAGDLGGGGGMLNWHQSNPTLQRVTFTGNTANFGGGMGNDGSSPTLTDVTFASNSVTVYGGGMSNESNSNPSLVNVTFAGNSSSHKGGAIYNWGSNPSLKHVTFSSNSSDVGGAIYNDANSNPGIVNSILYENLGGEIFNNSGSAVVTYSIIQGGYTGTGNLDQDPLLGSLQDNGGFTETMALGAGSPAIDTADDTNCPATDQRDVTRPQGAHCDIGAYEYDSPDSTVDVTIGDSTVDSYVLSPQESIRDSYPGVNKGPVKITNTDNVSMIAAERVIYKVNGVNTSFSELMGLPANQLDSTYWLPWYNNKDLDTQLRIANVSNTTATVRVYIGGLEMTGSPFMLQPGESTRKSFAGVNSGPVRIASNASIVASERILYRVNGVNTSFSEMMALPNSQLDTTYWLPWYNNKDLDTQLRIANVSGFPATVTVTIGGVPQPSFNLAAGASTRLSYPGVNNGPVEIVSTRPIVAAERVIYKAAGGVNTSFSEMMGLPANQLNTTYVLPWYNNKDLDTQLRIANVSALPATVHVYIGGVEMVGSPFSLAPGASTRKSFANVNSGPVKIVSTQNIVAAERVIYKVNGVNTSFSEMMGLPVSQLDTTFWFPWYNNVDLITQLRFGVP